MLLVRMQFTHAAITHAIHYAKPIPTGRTRQIMPTPVQGRRPPPYPRWGVGGGTRARQTPRVYAVRPQRLEKRIRRRLRSRGWTAAAAPDDRIVGVADVGSSQIGTRVRCEGAGEEGTYGGE
jgi:hypothetical protein